MELWMPIPGWEDLYEASDQGQVRSLPRMAMTGRAGMKLRPGRILKPGTYKDGHKHVTLSRDGKTTCYQVHKLVMLTFVGPCPEGLQIRHLNGIPDDNRLENLTYGTPTENARDRDERHGRNHQSNKTHCPQDHEYTEENTYVTPQGVRQCRICRKSRTNGECEEDGCAEGATRRGLCGKHYMQWHRSTRTEEQRAERRRRDALAARRYRAKRQEGQ